MRIRAIGKLLKDAGVKFWDDNGSQLGAALAYYTTLSLSPLLLVVVAIAGLAFGQEAARGEIVEQFRDTIGEEAAATVEQLVMKSSNTADGIFAAVVAFAVLLYGASSVFSQLQSALNAIWRVPGRTTHGGLMTILRERLLSFSLICGTAFLLLASLVISAILSGINGRISGWIPEWTVLARVLNLAIGFALVTVLFAMIFKWLPDLHLAWSDVWLGAVITAGLFTLGRYLIGLYLGKAAVGSAYGAAGAFVVLLVWIYYSTQILLFGAELTFVYAQRYGHGIDGEAVAPSGRPLNEPQPLLA